MRNKDTGEFELVVGDKQLLSAFFIGLLLMAVVFAMGYVLGQSSPKSAKIAPETATAAPTITTETRPPAASQATPGVTDPAAVTPPADSTDAGQAAATPPAEPPPQPTTVPAKEAGASPLPPARVAKAAPEPANASYWQVLAGSSGGAASMLQTLKSQGFPVSTRPGPNNLTLVWVGPYTDKESLSGAKKKLEEAGLTNIFKKP